MNKSTLVSLLSLVVSIGICLGAGVLGAAATSTEINGWYRTIAKPTWNPPDYLFGPVWTTLYVSMGIAAWLVWIRNGHAEVKVPLTLFGVQLALNSAWSFIFFRFHLLGWATVEIILLWLAIVLTTLAFMRVSVLAGWLMLPYLLWVSFACCLSFTIWRLNA
jgi:tryptophan-rich sensory protein